MIEILVALVIVGVLLYLLTLIPMDPTVRRIIQVVAILFIILWVLRSLGVWSGNLRKVSMYEDLPYAYAGWGDRFGKFFDGVASVVVVALGLFINKKLGVANEQRGDRILVNGLIAQEANAVKNGETVSQVLRIVETKLMDEHDMDPQKASVAVAAAQLANGLPTGKDANTTKMDDVLTGTRDPKTHK